MTPSTFLRLIEGGNIATPDLCLNECQRQFDQCIEENDDNPQLGRRLVKTNDSNAIVGASATGR